jgi:hypothetical protein
MIQKDIRNKTEYHVRDAQEVAPSTIEWLSFPTLEALYGSGLVQHIAFLLHELQALRSVAEVGSGAERVRARLACPGYRHLLALLIEMQQNNESERWSASSTARSR